MIPVTRTRIGLAVSVLLLLAACAAVPELTFESSDASADAGDASDSARDASAPADACAATCQPGEVCCTKANGGVLCKQAGQTCPP